VVSSVSYYITHNSILALALASHNITQFSTKKKKTEHNEQREVFHI